MSKIYTASNVCVGKVSHCVDFGGRYKGNVPSQAARKIASQASREYGLGYYYVTVREMTQGSSKKEHRYKIRVLHTTRAQREEALQNNLAFIPKTYTRIDKVFD